MRCFVMFVTAVCILFLLKLKWPKNKSFYDGVFFTISFFFLLGKSKGRRHNDKHVQNSPGPGCSKPD